MSDCATLVVEILKDNGRREAGPVAGAEHVGLAEEDGLAQDLDEQRAGLDGLRRGVRDPALVAGEVLGLIGVMKGEERDGREAHEGAVAGSAGMRGAGLGLTGADEACERLLGGDADFVTVVRAGVGALLPPADEAGGTQCSATNALATLAAS